MFCVQNWFTLIAQGLAKVCKMPTQWIMPMGIPVIQPYLKESTEKKFTMNYSIDELMKLKLVCSTLMNDMLILKNDLMVWNLFFVTIQWKSKVILVQQFFICHEMTILILMYVPVHTFTISIRFLQFYFVELIVKSNEMDSLQTTFIP